MDFCRNPTGPAAAEILRICLLCRLASTGWPWRSIAVALGRPVTSLRREYAMLTHAERQAYLRTPIRDLIGE